MPSSRATSKAARSTPVCPPETILEITLRIRSSMCVSEWEDIACDHSPLTTHHSLLTTHYSPLTTHHSLFCYHSPPACCKTATPVRWRLRGRYGYAAGLRTSGVACGASPIPDIRF